MFMGSEEVLWAGVTALPGADGTSGACTFHGLSCRVGVLCQSRTQAGCAFSAPGPPHAVWSSGFGARRVWEPRLACVPPPPCHHLLFLSTSGPLGLKVVIEL